MQNTCWFDAGAKVDPEYLDQQIQDVLGEPYGDDFQKPRSGNSWNISVPMIGSVHVSVEEFRVSLKPGTTSQSIALERYVRNSLAMQYSGSSCGSEDDPDVSWPPREVSAP